MQPRDEGFLAYGLPGAEEGGNEEACGVLGVTSGQDKKSRHAEAPIASEGAPDPDAVLSVRERLLATRVELVPKHEFRCESRKKNFEVVITFADRAPRRLHARPAAAEKSRLRW